MKPTIIRNRIIFQAPHHLKSKQLGAMLSKELQEKYHKHSIRVIEGDSVKVMRGEFKGIEGKITQISTEKNGAAIEGIKREKLKGGSVDLYIQTSNLMITSLNLEDKWRQNRLEGQKMKMPKEKPSAVEDKPKETSETKEKLNKTKSKQTSPPKTTLKEKIPKTEKSDTKKRKQAKIDKPAKKEVK